MRLADAASSAGTLEECLDQVNIALAGLHDFAPQVVAVALRAHLETLLQALLADRLCTRAEVNEFLNELQREALQYEAD